MNLDRFPRTRLAQLPTPIEHLPRLSAHLGGPEIFVKRDDGTGLALGGNKVRKLEFLVGDALAQGATMLVTTGGVQSNHARQTAAAAAHLGLGCELVLPEVVANDFAEYRANGNLLLDRLLGAAVHIVPDTETAQRRTREIEERVRSSGGVPYNIPVGGSTPIGALGYAAAAAELLQQSAAEGITFDAIVVASGSTGTHAGLLAGLHALQSGLPVHGCSVSGTTAQQIAKTVPLLEQAVEMLDSAAGRVAARVIIHDGYVGAGYGLPTEAMYEALALTAQLEGLLLDPVYTGKAMSGLIDLVRQGTFKRGQRILFWHTGGAPGLFAYESLLSDNAAVPEAGNR